MTELLIILGCVALNAGLAALEVAFVSASRAELQAHAGAGNLRVRRVLRLRETPERTLSAIQIGITLTGIVSGATGGAGALEVLGPFLQRRFDLGMGAAEGVAIAIVAILLMFITVVMGELVPKAFALRHPEHVVLVGAIWLDLLERVFFPVVNFLAWVTRTVVSVMPRPRAKAREAPAAGSGKPAHYALDLVDLGKHSVRDAPVPWSQTIKADVSLPSQSVADLTLSSGHTRLPIVRNGEVIGLLHTKELLRFLAAGEVDWRVLVRAVVTVRLDEPLLRVLRLLQSRRSHLAIVTGLDPAPVGIVTIEDILEQVLGDLYDEDDDRAVARLLASRGKLKALDGDTGA